MSRFTFPQKQNLIVALFVVFLFAYLTAGIYTELTFIEKKPLPERLLSDFRLYQSAYKQALEGESPYNGIFLYPPPSLLIVEFFSRLGETLFEYAFYLAVNISLLCFMLYALARRYDLKMMQVWYWLPLVFGFAPLFELLHYGQINLITSFGIFLLLYANPLLPWISGFGLSLAIVTKLSPLVFLGYLGATRQLKTIVWTLVFLILMTAIAWLRYGSIPLMDFPRALSELVTVSPININSHSLVSKLALFPRSELMSSTLMEPLQSVVKPLARFVESNPEFAQNILLLYFGLILIVSGLLTLKQRTVESLFIITTLSMLFYPNLVWYHHYVFLIVPLLVWMASAKLRPAVVAWCLMGMFIVQVDRWHLTYGLLIHIFGHISIWVILLGQIKPHLRTRTETPQGNTP
jgi:hypothetical protein